MGQPTESVSEIFQIQDKVLKRINNKDNHEKLISNKYDIFQFIKKYAKNPYITFMGNPPNIKQIESDIGIECIRKTSAGTLYSVHEISQGGLLYIFYETRNEPDNEYEQVYNWVYIIKNLKYDDFSSIKKGSSIESVEKIDPVTSVYKQRMIDYEPDFGRSSGAHSMHFLKDGILTLFYSYNNGKYEVDWQTYYNDFQLDFYYHSSQSPYNGKILPQDYPE